MSNGEQGKYLKIRNINTAPELYGLGSDLVERNSIKNAGYSLIVSGASLLAELIPVSGMLSENITGIAEIGLGIMAFAFATNAVRLVQNADKHGRYK